MKKFLLLLLMAIVVLSACGVTVNDSKEKVDEEQVKAKDQPEEKEDAESESPEGDKEDDGDASDIEIILPASFYEGMDPDEVIASLNEEGMDNVTANDDGTYTIKMSKEVQEAYLQELKADIDSDLQGMVEMMGVESITDISMNDDVTELTVSINQELYDGDMNGLVLMDFALYASIYQLMNGVNEEDFDFEVLLIDDQTGEEISRSSIHD